LTGRFYFKGRKIMVDFHGYKIAECGTVYGKRGGIIKPHLRKRNGGGFDLRVTLYIKGKLKHFTLQRLVAACYHGPVYGYEINHKDRNTMNNHKDNLERLTPSQNQKHWRDAERCRLSI
jgi:hypothetical protein